MAWKTAGRTGSCALDCHRPRCCSELGMKDGHALVDLIWWGPGQSKGDRKNTISYSLHWIKHHLCVSWLNNEFCPESWAWLSHTKKSCWVKLLPQETSMVNPTAVLRPGPDGRWPLTVHTSFSGKSSRNKPLICILIKKFFCQIYRFG